MEYPFPSLYGDRYFDFIWTRKRVSVIGYPSPYRFRVQTESKYLYPYRDRKGYYVPLCVYT